MTEVMWIKMGTMKQNKYLFEKYGFPPIDVTPYLPKPMK